MLRFRDLVATRLDDLRARGLLREPLTSSLPTGTHVVVRGRRLLNLSSNNYLGLADDRRLREALRDAAATWGGAGASRLISGTLSPHRAAERALAAFASHEDARLFSSGYAANVGVLAGLAGPEDVIFSDALNHASLIDGCRLSRARVVVYPHRDTVSLSRALETLRPQHRAAFVVTDAVFSMDADLAPLAALRQLADEHHAALVVDEAHALGVVGPEGRGLAAAHGVQPDVTTGMLGKAFGLMGGFVAADADTCRLLETTARTYVFSTGLHAALAAVLPAVIGWVSEANAARTQLRAHRNKLAAAVPARLRIPSGDLAPILPVLLGDGARALAASAALAERGFFAPGIRPPTVPPGTARLRLVPIATQSDDEISAAAHALAEVLADPMHEAARPRSNA